MREILFKAKHNGKWTEGFIQIRKITKDAVIWVENEHGRMTWLHVDINTVCQFTGLLDKGGNKIFEGDEIKTPYGMGKVSFYHACFMIEWIDDVEASMELVGLDSNFKSKRTDLEVIGNIHD